MKINNQPSQKASFESIVQARFFQFAKQHKNPLINLLYNERLRRILNMISCETAKNSDGRIVLDLGCGQGHFSRVLSLQFTTIGLDVEKGLKRKLRWRGKSRNLDFILADMRAMPLRSHSADIVVCASVLEHTQDLEGLIRKIKDVLKKDGILVAGYPVETKFFKFVWKRVSPLSFTLIDQSQTYWRNWVTGKLECYWERWDTHKQDYQTIRDLLRKHFKVLQKEKLPFNFFPDSITYYECIKMRNEI